MHTAATEAFQSALKTYAGVTGDPTYSEANGYMAIDAWVNGLKAAGQHPTQESLINTMLGMKFDGAGLYGGHLISFSLNDRGKTTGADNCLWFTRYSPSTFQLISGGDLICGTLIAGKKVTSG